MGYIGRVPSFAIEVQQITLSGDASGSTTIGGTEEAVITVQVQDDSHNHVISNIDDLQTALNLKANLASPTFTGTVSGITKTMVGLSSVDNTADTAKPVSTAQQTALNLKANLASPTFTGTPTSPTASAGTNTTQIATTQYVQTELSGFSSGATLSNDTTTNTTQYLGMSRTTSGAWTSAYISTTKLTFNPSTGTLSSTIFNSLSDERYKDNITPVSDSLNIIKRLDGVEFTWKENGEKSSGVIAQELEKVLPHLVNENEDGVKNVNYDGLTAYLIEANKELLKRVEELESKIG